MNTLMTYEACLEKIEKLREKMMNAAKKYGMSHPLVLDYSQELDRAHNVAMFFHDSNNQSTERTASFF
ncbi:aspartyl-phosphate phosphatase Spo0E family protein [Bacillus sp. FJAT-45037]|uniref:aspartyl-phosphate phosphatase Spo0E family protein n=1 Tax=Bacillus sp. FJAT-45037 TaxID=2011007 RepID=UPI000C24CF79|nr:aspartyl-phosphate phosphatase Spo0E family protein [Bacillus sp. FJAT-45037]